jgi:hypothetical protein
VRLLLLRKNRGPHRFSCVLADLPPDAAREVIVWGEETIPEPDLYHDPDDPSFGREREPHITVKYGLHDSEPGLLAVLFRLVPPIPVTLGRVSCFYSERYDVVKVEVKSPLLHLLNGLVSALVPVTDTYPTYVPHVTIAYVKPGEGKKYEGRTPFLGRRLRLAHVTFSSKGGARREFALGAACQ